MTTKMSLDELVKLRSISKANITRIGTWIKKTELDEVEVGQYISRKNNLNDYFKKYLDVQEQLELIEFDKYSADRDDVEEKYYNCDAYLYEKINQVSTNLSSRSHQNQTQSQTLSSPQSSNIQVKLPELKIPLFDGTVSSWPSFIELFSKLIADDSQLSDIQKLIYLKSVLKGEALQLIDNLEVIGSNFLIALDVLRNRFENKYLIINTHLRNLLNIPALSKNNAHNLREFVTQIKSNLDALNNLNISNQLADLILINLFSQKLDFNMKRSFENERNAQVLPSLQEFLDFIERKCRTLENLNIDDKFLTKNTSKPKHSLHTISHDNNQYFKCFLCKNNSHKIYSCQKFLNLSQSDRLKIITEKNACLNCLASGHLSTSCMSLSNCMKCNKRHHTLLHTSQQYTINNSQNSNNAQRNNHPNNNHSRSQNPRQAQSHETSTNQHTVSSHRPPDNPSSLSAFSGKNEVLLATASATVYDSENNPITVRCLMDSGSQISFITEDLVKRLNYTPYNKTVQISGISQSCSMSNQMVDVKLHSNVFPDKSFEVSCAILNKITCKHPQVPINLSSIKIPQNIRLADPHFSFPSEVHILLGADVYFELLKYGLIKLGRGLPTLQNTHLGYIVAGNIPYHSQASSNVTNLNVSNTSSLCISLFTQSTDVDNLIKSFWEIEELPSLFNSNKAILSPLEQQAENIFQSSLEILPSGRFQVDLPLIGPAEHKKLGDSFHSAKKRFLNLEKKLVRSESLYSQYRDFISEYVSLGHCKYVPLTMKNELSENKYFLPHHCVLKEDSITTKLRVVFDGSMKTSSGVSLNDILLKGYTVQPDLFDILIRFRTFKFVLIADIQKMFRQININPQQTFLLNILWRDTPNEEIKCLELQTVTYGTKPASFLSTRCLKQLAIQNKHKHPLASEALLNSCYVDDILFGSNDLDVLFESHRQISECLKSACIPLHKWSSNSPQFLESIAQTSQDSNYVLSPENSSNKVLGICWNSQSDSFSIVIPKIMMKDSYTKREVLSTIASIYDPIGLINPVVVTAKLIMQKIWLAKLDWNDKLHPECQRDWTYFLEDIQLLSNIRVNRPLLNPCEISKIEIHGFADASMKAYGACIYLRTIHVDNSVTCHLITSKSRVAPLKVITLPKLELMGVTLLATLTSKVLSILKQSLSQIESVNLWTDSEIVLAWLNSHPSRWATFVANRVARVQELTSNFKWRHIKSKDNPADILSRGSSPTDLVNCSLWWHGSPFLLNPNIHLGDFDSKFTTDDIPEERKSVHLVKNSESEIQIYDNFKKFSSFSRLQRVVAYCLRFVENLRNKKQKQTDTLSLSELENAEAKIVQVTQKRFFTSEIRDLQNSQFLQNKAIQRLNPFLDSSGVIRVGGRLQNANISYCQKFPILLPSKSHVVQLLLKREHLRLLHAGPQNTLSNIRLSYWPLDALREIKRIIYNCNICYRYKAKAASQIMSHLPKERLQTSRPFTNVGVDYGGPFLIKSSKLKRAPLTKSYMAVFVCLVTRAVHIELVSELSTEAFLLTLKRFIARRGNPSVIFSDNASNFLGAKNQLKELLVFFRQKNVSNSIKNFTTACRIDWKFIPPRSPHHGGMWEAAIKSAKYHIVRIIGNNTHTFEELATILAQIEAVLNSRPICTLSTDPSDLSFLTPGHFLIGSNLTSYPERDVSCSPENRLTRWQNCSRIQQQFWKLWTKDYLNRLQNRPKWYVPQTDIAINDLVLLKEDNVTPLRWPVARVIETLPGQDNKIRVVKLKTKDGVFTRSIAKVCPLPSCETVDI